MSNQFWATWATLWCIGAFAYGLYLSRRPEPTDAQREDAITRLAARS